VFRERGVEASVGEIAAAAGIGRGTFFRNFPSKRDLIVAVVAAWMWETIEQGRALLERGGDEELLFEFVQSIVCTQQTDRALFEVLGEEGFLASEEIAAAYRAILEVLDELIRHDVDRGYVREGIGGIDVLMLVKGVCAVAASLGEAAPITVDRHLSLIHAALAAPGRQPALSGETPRFSDLHCPGEPATA
jgi:AcrR family transcriptional regulator